MIRKAWNDGLEFGWQRNGAKRGMPVTCDCYLHCKNGDRLHAVVGLNNWKLWRHSDRAPSMLVDEAGYNGPLRVGCVAAEQAIRLALVRLNLEVRA
jgi:hypothetical protein